MSEHQLGRRRHWEWITWRQSVRFIIWHCYFTIKYKLKTHWSTMSEHWLGRRRHWEWIGTVHNMALVFYHQGGYEDAPEWCERALAGTEKALGVDHLETIGTVHNMALLLYYQV
ncbi:hypothetical protein BGX38DRAFT_1210460 [Terfezia claveryi]|nr:hypothetical protein BGX38DRAFT_1210460 [Terfezia claveryi]